MNRISHVIGIFSVLVTVSFATAASIAVGAAPKGDASAVASRIIKYNFPDCRRVSGAARAPDGSIRAQCDESSYIVFTMFNAEEGKLLELALNCTAAKKLLNISC
jgi:hypothetical protein